MKQKQTLFERMGLVEREPSFPDPYTMAPVESPPVPEVTVEAQILAPENIVSEIYAQNGLTDRPTSIFTVHKLIATLPAEMPTTTKQTTVAGILSVSGTSIADLLADADERIAILNAARDKILEEREAEITATQGDIERLKGMIEEATKKIHEAEQIIENTKRDIDNERDGIDSLIVFCKGMEATT